MRKPQFYAKLAAGNLWRNRASYLPYLLACVTSIFTLYCLWAILYSGTLTSLPANAYVESFTLIGGVITALFCSVLLFWTNAYLIKRRKQELALYSILGMEKRNIAIVMLFETLYIAIISLGLGILGGMLLSRLLFAAMMRLIRQPVEMRLDFSPWAVIQTCLFFGVVFLLILVRNLRQVRLTTPASLLAGAKEGEKEPKANWLLVLLGIGCLGGGYYIAFTITQPVIALFMFLLAVLLVIIGTYCLFTAGSIAVLKLLRRNKGYYYQPGHFISVSGMIYRMKQNAAGLASICVLSCMVLVTVASTVTLYAGADDSLTNQYPYEYSVSYYSDTILNGIENTIQEIATDAGVELVDYGDFISTNRSFFQNGNRIMAPAAGEMVCSLGFVTLENYNHLHGANETLQKGEALIYYTESFDFSAVEQAGNVLDVYGVPLKVRTVPELTRLPLAMPTMEQQAYLILPDEQAIYELYTAILAEDGVTDPATIQEAATPTGGYIQFDIEGTEEQRAAFYQAFKERLGRHNFDAGVVYEYAQQDMLGEWYATMGGFLFLGIYFSIMFLLATVLIIYYKQVSEGYEDRERFTILQKVGMSEREVKKAINGQIRMVFYLPLLVAVIHIAVGMRMVRRALIIFGVLDVGLLVLATAVTVLLYALVYLLVYRRTAHTYFRIVRREA